MAEDSTSHNSRSAFTLVELLVVITIIVVLLALLAPALDSAVQSAQTAVCLSNLHNVGIAISAYHTDHKSYYPMLDTWWTLLGKKEAFNPLIPVPSDVKDRPLNAYLGYTSNGSEVPVARCPSDLGDPHWLINTPHLYTYAGTSYLGAFNPNDTEPWGNYGVKIIFGFIGRNPRNEGWVSWGPLPSTRWTTLERMDNKVVVMDAIWHSDEQRTTDNPQVRWHRPDSPERYLSTLFADSHAELFDWDREFIDTYGTGPGRTHKTPYNPSWKWW
jgi:prepilin-type N-terminal cleavage/methylation domain-containing protein